MYHITLDEDSMEFTVVKNGEELPFNHCHNIRLALEGALGIICRTESEVKRRQRTDIDKHETPAAKMKRIRDEQKRTPS